MPSFGGKIWFTAIAGLVLGFVLFGMIQRGCDASGSEAVQTTERVDPQSRTYNTTTRNNVRTIEPIVRNNSNSRSANSRRETMRQRAQSRASAGSSRANATTRDRAAVDRGARLRSREDAARRAELARLTRERTQKYRDRARNLRADDPNILDPVLRAQTTGGSVEDAVAQAAAEASAELHAQRGEGSGSGSGSGRSGGDGPGSNGPGSDGDGADPGDGDGGADDPFAEIARALEGLGLDQSLVDLVRQVVSGNAPPTNPFLGGDDNDPDEPENPHTEEPQSGDEPDLTTPVLARWIQVEHDGCSSLGAQGLVTYDLFLAFLDQPPAPPVLSSVPAHSLVIVDGAFHQSPAGTNGPPAAAADGCDRFDTYLTLGKAAPTFLTAPNPQDWGDRLIADWFALFGVEIERDTDRFGDNRHHIHVARITAESEAKVFGGLRVDLAGNRYDVDVPDWQGADTEGLEDDIPPPAPKILAIQLSSTGVLSGSALEGTVTLDRPAPAGGALVTLSTNKPGRVAVPAEIRVPEGATSAAFAIQTFADNEVENATITASTTDSQATVTLTLRSPSILSFEALRPRLLGGETTSAVVRLAAPAFKDGATIALTVDNPSAVSVPPTVRIPAGQFSTVVTIEALDTDSSSLVTISAVAGGATRSIQIEIVPALSVIDTNNDGVVDTADLGRLIGAFGSSNTLFDFNGDGVVDTADLGLLTGRFGQSYDPGDGGGPDDPPGGENEDAVIAKWLDVPQDDCAEFPGSRTADLYLGFLDQPGPPVLTSNAEHGIAISGGEFLHHEFGTNAPPNEAALESFPCLKYDSYLSIGGKQATFLGAPDQTDWGQRIEAIWFRLSTDFEQDISKFGDNRHYLHIARITASTSASVGGSLRADYAGELAFVEIPDWSAVAALALDFNLDGIVDAADLTMVVRAYGSSASEYDTNGDGQVDGEDLRPLLRAIENGGGY